jgi:tRNA(Arg) A34 adenosine deaminase TadA
MRDPFLQAAIDEAKQGLAEGGIPIGSVIVHRGTIMDMATICACRRRTLCSTER